MADTSRTSAPYGSWRSPLTAAALAAGTVDLAEPCIDGSDIYWLEGRPSEDGRVVVVRRAPDGDTQDVTQAPFNVRSRVHEYGGGAYDVADGVLVFCNFSDRRVYRIDVSTAGVAEPRPITPEGPLRYGDLRIDSATGSVLAVCEDHSTSPEATNRLVRLMLEGGNEDGGTVLVEGHDFFSSPTLSPDGSRLAWLQWDHPNMPWDATELCVAAVDPDGSLSGDRVVAGGPAESVTQPQWMPDGRLVFISDRSGWWNLYATDLTSDDAPEPLWEAPNDFSDPHWVFGMSSYALPNNETLLCSWLDEGYARLESLDLATGRRRSLGGGLTAVTGIRVGRDFMVCIAGYAELPAAIIRVDIDHPDRRLEVVRRSGQEKLEAEWVSVAEPVTWRAANGDEVYGFYYPPRNPEHVGPAGELPPLLVNSHGGPTGISRPMFNLGLQLWTSRGFAVLHVNYGGSSGYGRAYRERLRGNWGVVDVDDCVSGALAMADSGKADRERLAIRGGSAGGYTTLSALTFRDVFTAGASLFGVADLEGLAKETHKFESRYLDGLVGPYPEDRERYVERSPIHHVDKLSCPMILLQGADDLVVPKNQAEAMAAAVRAKGLPVALLVFDGEGHGFRKAENVIRAFEAEAYFYSRVFGFDLADDVQPVEIANLPSGTGDDLNKGD